MALLPAKKLHFSGTAPYADDGTSDSAGAFHLHKLKRGSKVEFVIDVDPDDSLLLDVTLYTFESQFRTSADGSLELTLTVVRDPSDVSATPSKLLCTAAPGLTENMSLNGGTWDLEAELISDTTVRDRWYEGTWAITADTTHD